MGLAASAVAVAVWLGSDVAGAAPKRGSGGCTTTGGALPSAQPLAQPLPASLVAQLSILRRAQGPQDQLPPLSPLGELGGLELGSYYTTGIRRLATESDGTEFFVIPGFRRPLPPVPLSCVTRGLGPKKRSRVLALIKQEQAQPQQPVYCLATLGGTSTPTFDCTDFSMIATGFAITRSGDGSHAVLVGLVPDGVGSVVISYAGHPAAPAPASENFFIETDPSAAAVQAIQNRIRRIELRGAGRRGFPSLGRGKRRKLIGLERQALKDSQPTSVDWVGPDGHLIKHFVGPPSSPTTGSSGGITLIGGRG